MSLSLGSKTLLELGFEPKGCTPQVSVGDVESKEGVFLINLGDFWKSIGSKMPHYIYIYVYSCIVKDGHEKLNSYYEIV